MSGLSKSMIAKLVRAGLPENEANSISQNAARQWLGERQTPGSSRDGDTFAEAQRRTQCAIARLRELEVIEKEGQVVFIDDVAKVWESQIQNVRSRLLALPVKLAPNVAMESSPVVCREMIEVEIHDALTELSSGVGRPEFDEADETGAAAHPRQHPKTTKEKRK